MHTILLELAIVWLTLLAATLLVMVARSRSFLSRILALDTLSLVVVALLAVIAHYRHSVHYLDAALALALLAFIGTLAAVQYRRFGEFL